MGSSVWESFSLEDSVSTTLMSRCMEIPSLPEAPDEKCPCAEPQAFMGNLLD